MTPPPLPAPLVLYVDDEPANRLVFTRSFASRFRIEAVASGEEALVRVAQETPAVVIADQRMPGMPGTELLAALRERSPDTVRVILTAYADPGPMLEAINRAGAARYLVKPWNPQEMAAVIDGAIAAFKLTREVRDLELKLFDAQRFSSIGVVAASVAHDMASPVSALVANTERLLIHADTVRGLWTRAERGGLQLSEAEQDLKEELGDIAEESHQSASYLATLVQGMRGQARSGGDAVADPTRALTYVTSLVRGVIQEKGATLRVECPDELPSAAIATPELCQVLVNLCTNAAQALSRQRPTREVRVRVAEEKGGLRFEVEDTGAGMTAEQVQRAGRERFTTKPEGQGTGLGLPICRALVERAGGSFELTSVLGEGTRVRFWLPAAEG